MKIGVRLTLALMAGVFLALLVGACGGAEGKPGSPRVLSTEEAKKLLLQLPYRYEFRKVKLPEGASGALAGKVTGPHHTVVNFGIALGTEAEAVPVPKIGTRDSGEVRKARTNWPVRLSRTGVRVPGWGECD